MDMTDFELNGCPRSVTLRGEFSGDGAQRHLPPLTVWRASDLARATASGRFWEWVLRPPLLPVALRFRSRTRHATLRARHSGRSRVVPSRIIYKYIAANKTN